MKLLLIAIAVFSSVLIPNGLRAATRCVPHARRVDTTAVDNASVEVYWDLSKSMRAFHTPMREIVSTLDAAILLQAGASRVSHFGIGATVHRLRNATPALSPDENWTALHTAAEQAARDLAGGRAGAAIFISDMILELPDKERRTRAEACAGVPMPSTAAAGALFGRCISSGLGRSVLRDAFASVVRIPFSGRRLYVLVIASNVTIGRDVTRLMATTWHFPEQMLDIVADTESAMAASEQVTCNWTPQSFTGLRIANAAAPDECRFRCEDEGAVSSMKCGYSLPATTWVTADIPAARTLQPSFSRTTSVAANGFTFQLRCPRGSRYVTAGTVLTFRWKHNVPRGISTDADVQRLFEGFARAVAAAVPEHSLEVTLEVE